MTVISAGSEVRGEKLKAKCLGDKVFPLLRENENKEKSYIFSDAVNLLSFIMATKTLERFGII